MFQPPALQCMWTSVSESIKVDLDVTFCYLLGTLVSVVLFAIFSMMFFAKNCFSGFLSAVINQEPGLCWFVYIPVFDG